MADMVDISRRRVKDWPFRIMEQIESITEWRNDKMDGTTYVRTKGYIGEDGEPADDEDERKQREYEIQVSLKTIRKIVDVLMRNEIVSKANPILYER